MRQVVKITIKYSSKFREFPEKTECCSRSEEGGIVWLVYGAGGNDEQTNDQNSICELVMKYRRNGMT